MKILIEESVLRQALETFTHCYAETDRRINERAKLLVELRTSLDAAEKVEPVAWLYYEHGEECFGHPDGYRPDNAVALYSLEGIKK